MGTSRNARIDLLRGVAILLVVIHHLALRIPLEQGFMASGLARRVIDGFCYHGYEMVFVVFVICGFLIATNAALCWVLASVVDKTISTPCNRSWRARLTRTGAKPALATLTAFSAHPKG
jgi:uncharacterized membrane protein YcfT